MEEDQLTSGWLRSFADEAIVIDEEDINFEANSNLRLCGLTKREAQSTSVASLVAFMESMVFERSQWLVKNTRHPMMIYFWHDEMAGQLRFSLVSSVHNRLPFGCDIQVVESPRPIAERVHRSPYLGEIPWLEFDEARTSVEQSEPFVQRVWTELIP